MGFTDRDWPDGPSQKDKAGYTKGKWWFDKGAFNDDSEHNDSIGSVRAGDEEDAWYIARIENTYEAEANAKLIAESPRMAEWIAKVAKQDFVVFPEDKVTAVSILAEVKKC